MAENRCKDTNDDSLFVKGGYGEVRFAVSKTGFNIARKGLLKLNSKKTKKKTFVLFKVILIHWAKTGQFTKTKKDDNSVLYPKIIRIKPKDAHLLRLTFFYKKNKRVCYLTSIYKKGSKKQNNEALKKADDARKEHEMIMGTEV